MVKNKVEAHGSNFAFQLKSHENMIKLEILNYLINYFNYQIQI